MVVKIPLSTTFFLHPSWLFGISEPSAAFQEPFIFRSYHLLGGHCSYYHNTRTQKRLQKHRSNFAPLPPQKKKTKRHIQWNKNINLIQLFAKKGRLKQPPSTINLYFPHRGFGTAKSWVQASMSSMRFRRCGVCGVFYVEKNGRFVFGKGLWLMENVGGCTCS